MTCDEPPFMEWPFAEEVFDTPDLPLENGKKRKSSDVSEMSPLGHPGWVLDPYMVEGEEQTEQASQRNRVQAHAPPSLSVARISDYHVFSPSRTNPAYSLWSLSTFGLLACNDEFAAVTGYGSFLARPEVRNRIQAGLRRLKLANELLIKGRISFIQHRLTFVTYSGRLKEVHLSVVVLYDQNGRPAEGATFLTDITNVPDKTIYPETPLEPEALAAELLLPRTSKQQQYPHPSQQQLSKIPTVSARQPPHLVSRVPRPAYPIAPSPQAVQPPCSRPATREKEFQMISPPEQASKKSNAKPWETNTATFKWRKVNRWSHFSNTDYPA